MRGQLGLAAEPRAFCLAAVRPSFARLRIRCLSSSASADKKARMPRLMGLVRSRSSRSRAFTGVDAIYREKASGKSIKNGLEKAIDQLGTGDVGHRSGAPVPFRRHQHVVVASAWLGAAYYMLGRYAEAVKPLQQCASRGPNLRLCRLWLAATYAQLGQMSEARDEASQVLRIDPKFTIGTVRPLLVFKDPDKAEHYFDGLRKARLPEQ